MNKITEVVQSLFQRAWMRNIGLGVSRWPKHSPACCFLAIAVMEPRGCEEPLAYSGAIKPPRIQVPVPLGPLSDHIRSFQVIHRRDMTDAISVVASGITLFGASPFKASIINRNLVIHTGISPFLSIQRLPTIGPEYPQHSPLRNSDNIVYHTGDFNNNGAIDAIGINRSSKIYFQSGLTRLGQWYDFSDPKFRACSVQFVQDEKNGENYLLLVGLSGELKALKYRERHNRNEFPFYLDPTVANGMPIEFEHHIEYITRGGKLIAISTCEALDNNIENRSKEFDNQDLDDDGSYDRITIEKNDSYQNSMASTEEDRKCKKYGKSCAYIQWGPNTTDEGPKKYLDIYDPARLAIGNFLSKSGKLDIAITQSDTIVFFENKGGRKFEKNSDDPVIVNYGYPHESIDEIRTGNFDDDNTDDLAVLTSGPGMVTLVLSEGKL